MAQIAIAVTVENPVGPEFIATTKGLTKFEHPEIMVAIQGEALLDEAKKYLTCVSEYIVGSNARIQSDQTLVYGYWLTTFKNIDDNLLETWEYNADATEFIRGASLTLQYWKDQHLVCDTYKSTFAPPLADQLSIISKGVFEGLPVQGVRYPSPDNMSGWWITTDEYDGNVASLTREHTYHVTARRPELAKYLALNTGYRFDFSTFEDVWFDEEVAKA